MRTLFMAKNREKVTVDMGKIPKTDHATFPFNLKN